MKQVSGLKTPALLQQFQWILNPVGYMESAVQELPDIFAAQIVGFGNRLIFVNDPQAIQYILTNDRKEFTAPGEINKILTPLVGDTSIFLLSGDRHRRQRQLLMPPFHGDRMRTYGQLIADLSEQAMSQIPANQVFQARSATQSISLQVMLQAVFGVQQGKSYDQLQHLTGAMADTFSSPLASGFLFFPSLQQDWGTWSPWGKFLQQRQRLDDLLYAEIADRRAYPDASRTDILSMLMTAKDEAGQPMTDQELRDELVSLLIAGHETTATAMAWALYWIHHLPEVRTKLLAELDSLNGDLADTIANDPMAIARLPYLSAVCQETLRIYPIAMLTFPRQVQQPMELLGYSLEPGTILVGCIYLVHQRPDLYPNPKQFQPQRFLEKKFSGYEFMAFGGGARRCIGEALALFEMKLALAVILSRYELALAEPRSVRPQRRGVTLAPASVKLKMVGRRK
ncbi:MAG: cytochrome P450 [Drouetiella hepatica Uher 2000/2452]|jgi:cytochrome P450|uniref:Cytochrome P450 n=1 Tax=Drouetiella hepatica Uher 2000/2452 TaxID=904376 RepID=A0A951Q879_9CYAN|nr:cytochrome P450 [Drouetiella hepatica Uher 2000/2452]